MANVGTGAAALFAEPVTRHMRVVERSIRRRAATSARRTVDEEYVAALCAAKAGNLRPSSAPPASARFAALRDMVRAREAAAPG